MIRGKCPTCKKPFAVARLDELPSFPFCTDRCKLIDLGRWIDGAYAIPAAEPPPPTPEAGAGGAADDEED
jgi:endogenous inhibitor of DNA gyrase (YacG/DUF329 family)